MGRDKTEAARSHSRGAFRPSYSINFTLQNAEGAGKTGWPLHPGPPRKKLREERVNHRYRRDQPLGSGGRRNTGSFSFHR